MTTFQTSLLQVLNTRSKFRRQPDPSNPIRDDIDELVKQGLITVGLDSDRLQFYCAITDAGRTQLQTMDVKLDLDSAFHSPQLWQ